MAQINTHTRKERPIRPPMGMQAPGQPLVPPGPTMVVVVPQNPGAMMMVPHPQMPGEQIQVQVPPGAKPGQNMVVPVPKKGMGAAGMAVAGAIIGDHLAGGGLGPEGAVNMLGGAV